MSATDDQGRPLLHGNRNNLEKNEREYIADRESKKSPDEPRINCAENDPGSIGYVPNATAADREYYARRADEAKPSTTTRPDNRPSTSPVVEPYDHVMVDIETMSLDRHNALILSVGLLEFDPDMPHAPRLGARMLILPVIAHQLALGREVSKGTQKFWMDQKPEAREHWLRSLAERTSLVEMCHRIRGFCEGKSRVWANGTQFDLSNLEALNTQVGIETPLWHYQAPRDMRTFCRETPATRLIPIGDALDIRGVEHEPVYDCEVQAWKVWAHWQDH